jgi:hypothetical protein
VKKTFFERWCEKVDMKDPDDCWDWLGFKNKDGYGFLKNNKKNIRAHRYAYAQYKNNGQPIPNNLCVCHHCDNPSCVNPNHLFLGTHTDNMQDMLRKGRHRFNPRLKKHTDDEVIKIRLDYSSGLSQEKVAKLNNTAQMTVSRIVNHKPPYER